MRTTTRAIEAAWIRIQEEFLTHPAATLTAADVRQRAAIDATISDAVLEAMLDAGVVERRGAGYRLAMPQRLAA